MSRKLNYTGGDGEPEEEKGWVEAACQWRSMTSHKLVLALPFQFTCFCCYWQPWMLCSFGATESSQTKSCSVGYFSNALGASQGRSVLAGWAGPDNNWVCVDFLPACWHSQACGTQTGPSPSFSECLHEAKTRGYWQTDTEHNDKGRKITEHLKPFGQPALSDIVPLVV